MCVCVCLYILHEYTRRIVMCVCVCVCVCVYTLHEYMGIEMCVLEYLISDMKLCVGGDYITLII